MLLKTGFFHLLEKSVNFLLSKDPDSAERLLALEDKVIALDIKLTDRSLIFYWLFEQQHVRLLSEWQGDIDAKIAGPLQAIAEMGLSKAKVAKDLTVSGDMHVVEAFKTLFAKLDIDWEAQLAPFTGDALAYKIGKTVKQTHQWLKQAQQSFRASSKDYLEEEINLLPSKLRMQDFSDDVRQLNRDVDRLAAKIKRLAN
jgi:ubiquinone biosynthesis protein UbiJ